MSRWIKKAKQVSYLLEMLKEQKVLYGFLGSLALGTIMSIPFGIGIALLPLLGFGAATSIAALFVPGSPAWRAKIDKRKHDQMREKTREHLISEIVERAGSNHAYWNIYNRMRDRLESLRRVAAERDNALTEEDCEQLDDKTVDFLGMWLGRIAIQERHQSFSQKDLAKRIAELDAQLAEATDENNQRRLRKALADLNRLLVGRKEMATRDAAAEAAMLAMSDSFDELYQRVMANPTSQDDVVTGVRVAVDRMNIEEELDFVLEEEVEAMLHQQ